MTAPLRTPTSQILEAYGRLPLYFEENRGQADPAVRFLARAEGGAIALTREGLALGLEDGTVRLTFAGAATPTVEAVEPLPGRVNYYIGRDRSQWRTDIPTYGRVRYARVYAGVDVVVYGNRRQLEYDFVVAPGADPRAIRVRVDGADALELRDGDLVIRRGARTIVQQAPVIFQERDGRREPVTGRYVLRGRDVAFAVGAYDRSRPLIIDPVIVYAAKVGPADAKGIAVDGAGSAIITGESNASAGYPQVNPAFGPKHVGFADFVVTKLTPAGDALVYSTFIGSFGPDTARSIAVDSAGNAWVAGYCGGLGGTSTCGDFPTTPGAVNTTGPAGGSDSSAGVLAKFSPTGSLLYSTFLTGTSTGAQSLPSGACKQTRIHGIAVDAADSVYAVGYTQTIDYPTTAGAYQTSRAAGPSGDYCHGDTAAVVTKLTSGGALAYSTYLDAVARDDRATAVAVDTAGNAYVTGFGDDISPPGTTSAPPFTVTATLTASGTQEGGYVVKLNATSFPTQATIIGPTPVAIDVGADGSAYVTGQGTAELVTVNAFQPTGSGGFAARINPAGTAYMWSTYVGGQLTGLALDAGGNAWLVGSSASTSFPTKDPIMPKTSATEVVVVQLSATGTLLFGSPVATGTGAGIAVDLATNVYLTGNGTSPSIPTPGAFNHSSGNLFVMKLGAGEGGGEGPEPVVWTSPVKVAVDGNTITKTSGCEGCADAGAISQQTIASGDGFAEFKVSSNEYLTVGLSNGNPGTSGTEIDFGLRFHAGSPAAVQIRESGVYKAEFLHIAGATYKIAVEGGAVKYYQNGVLKYTSTLAPTYPLLVDTSLLTLGAAVQNAMISSGSGGGPPPPDAPPTVSITAPSSGATVSGNAVTVSANASDDIGVASVQFQLDGVNLGAADTTMPYSITWDTTTATNGPHTLTAIATDTTGQTTTSAPVTVTVDNGGSPPGPGPGPVVWTSAVNVAVSGNSITKNAGCNGCADAGAISEQTIPSGGGSVSFGIGTGSQMTVGLGTGNAGTSGTDVEFGLRFYPGSPGYVEVRESGAYKWDFAHVPGATYKVAVEAGVVKYYQNGVLKYTSTVAPSFPLVVDTSLVATGSAVQNAVIGP